MCKKVENLKMTTPDLTGMLKMKDLAKATGVNKSTVTHYVNEGLLHEPIRTKRNVAYYDPACVERINFIKELQAKHRLPLSIIKKALILRDKGKEVTPYVERIEALVGWQDSQRLEKREFCKVTGLSEEFLDKSLKKRILFPLEKDVFDAEDVAIGKLLCLISKLGVTVEDASYYPKYAEKIVEEELKLRDYIVTSQSYKQSGTVTLDMTKVARSLRAYVIDRFFQHKIIERERHNSGKKSSKVSASACVSNSSLRHRNPCR
jgi:DNA-binding transcriptional MerR regulator